MSIWRDREGNSYFIDQNNHTKAQTLLLRRAPDGKVITLAGGGYGHADGKGTSARFSSVGGVAFGRTGVSTWQMERQCAGWRWTHGCDASQRPGR